MADRARASSGARRPRPVVGTPGKPSLCVWLEFGAMQEVQEGSGRGTLLVVAGPGRSGTSLLTGLVSRLGLYIPRPEVLANKSNPRGFSEPRWAVDFHKELLASLDVTIEDSRPDAWDRTARVTNRSQPRQRLQTWLREQFSESSRVVIKDPRLAWFLDLYREVAVDIDVDLSVVTMLRHPTESMRSRELAYGTGANSTTRLTGWINLVQSVELRTRDLPRATIEYEHLLTDWRGALAAAEGPLALPLLSAASDAQIEDANDLVDVGLHRSTADWSSHEVPADLQSLGQRTYDAMSAASASGPGPAAANPGTMDELRGEYVAMFRNAEAISRSSILAARADERRKVTKKRKAHDAAEVADADQQPPPAPAAPPPKASSDPLSVRRIAGAVKRRALAWKPQR